MQLEYEPSVLNKRGMVNVNVVHSIGGSSAGRSWVGKAFDRYAPAFPISRMHAYGRLIVSRMDAGTRPLACCCATMLAHLSWLMSLATSLASPMWSVHDPSPIRVLCPRAHCLCVPVPVHAHCLCVSLITAQSESTPPSALVHVLLSSRWGRLTRRT